MKIENVPFTITDWSEVPESGAKGETGMVRARGVEMGNIRVRMAEFSPGYRADHWCSRGHVVLMQEGDLAITLRDGRRFHLKAGMSLEVGDSDNAHMIESLTGGRAFIVD